MSLETRITKLENGIGAEDESFRFFIKLVYPGKTADGWRCGDRTFFREPGETNESLIDRIDAAVSETGIILLHPVYEGGDA